MRHYVYILLNPLIKGKWKYERRIKTHLRKSRNPYRRN